ncbi:MAG TPA: hypothetical protein ENH01_01535 [Nitrospirae bacterium]|nr:hypothetical protein [Nitrospirota bacterium]
MAIISISSFFLVAMGQLQVNGFTDLKQSKFLFCDSQEIAVGFFKKNKLELNPLNLSLKIEDIHNCSYSKEKKLIIAAVSNRQFAQHEILFINPNNGLVNVLMKQEIIYHVSISNSGENIVFTAPPTKGDNGVSLYLYDLEKGLIHLLVADEVHRLSIPSWSIDGKKIVYHDIHNQIICVNFSTGEKREIFTTGEFPVFSPFNANQIAYIKDGRIYIWDFMTKASKEIFRSNWFWQSEPFGRLSWSINGKYIIFCRATGLTGYKKTFYAVNVKDKKVMKIYEGYIKELQFM